MNSMRKCCVVGCVPQLSASFHRIPANTKRRTTWLNLLHLPMTTTGRVCSAHFESSEIVITGGRVWLNSTANPKMLVQENAQAENEMEFGGDCTDGTTTDEVMQSSMRKCCVVGCVPQLSASFHRIPANTGRRTTWLNLLHLPMTTTGRVCSAHFESSDIVITGGRVWLNSTANPKMLLQEITEAENEMEFGGVCSDAADEVVVNRQIYKEHNYSKYPSKMNPFPMQHANNLFIKNRRLRAINFNLRKEIKKINRKHKTEQKKFKNFDKLPDFLQEFFVILLNCHKKRSTPKQYPPLIRKFALSLHYYSPAGYRYVRDAFNNCLPHTQTIASWYRVIDGSPGFTNESLDALTRLQQNTPFEIVVNIVLDGMAIRKMLQRMGNKTVGFTDFGGVIPEVDEKSMLANEALIFMAVGVNVPFKVPIGNFLISGITGKHLAYLVEIAVTLVIQCRVIPGTLIFDGPKTHFAMAKELGCDFRDMKQPTTKFAIEGQNVYIFPDMCHMMKLARNFICDEGTFLDGKKRVISWKYFKNLHDFQTSQGIHVANKLRRLHVMYKNQIMKVYLATQLLSASVADAIEFCDETLQLPDFKHSEGTVEFIRVMNDIFDIFNSRDMNDTFYKQPIHQGNRHFIMNRLEYIKKYLLELTYQDGKPIHQGPKKTFIVGMLTLIESLDGFYEEFVVTRKLLTYVPTYKMSQDSVEIYNCSMRSCSGYNSNPSAVAFKSAYKKSLLHIQFHDKLTGNCRPLEDMPILNCSSSNRRVANESYTINDEEMEASFENAIMPHSFRINWQGYYSVIAYISGYIARRLATLIKCETCATALIHQTDDSIIVNEDDEDQGYDDTMGDVEDNATLYENTIESSRHSDAVPSHRNIHYDDTESIGCDRYENIDYDNECDVAADMGDIGFDDDDGINYSFDDEDSEMNNEGEDAPLKDHYRMDLNQIDGIARNYFDLIKKKDRGGLFYPSDSLYRMTILSDIIFSIALKESGGKRLHRKWTLDRLIGCVLTAHMRYSENIFSELQNHFQNNAHEEALLKNIAKFYLKMRIDFSNKTFSANNGSRQKLVHAIHFGGM